MKAQNKKIQSSTERFFGCTEVVLKPNGQQKWEFTLQEPTIFVDVQLSCRIFFEFLFLIQKFCSN
jgi:hypothetical protein